MCPWFDSAWHHLQKSLVFTGLLGLALGGLFIYSHFLKDLPDFTTIKEFRPSVVTTIFARDGRLIGELDLELQTQVVVLGHYVAQNLFRRGIDPVGRAESVVLFRELAARGKCLLVSSHELDELEKLTLDVDAKKKIFGAELEGLE